MAAWIVTYSKIYNRKPPPAIRLTPLYSSLVGAHVTKLHHYVYYIPNYLSAFYVKQIFWSLESELKNWLFVKLCGLSVLNTGPKFADLRLKMRSSQAFHWSFPIRQKIPVFGKIKIKKHYCCMRLQIHHSSHESFKKHPESHLSCQSQHKEEAKMIRKPKPATPSSDHQLSYRLKWK